jgi:hypothetical protein
MANNSALIDWVLPKISALNINISRAQWVDKWLPGYFDYRVTMPFNGEVCVGRGIAKSEILSFEKAITEVFERASVKFPQFVGCSWGTAGFPDFDGAKKRAYFELLAIDRVLCHHFCKKKIKPVPLFVLNDRLTLKVLEKNLFKNKIQFNLYELTPAMDARVVVALASGKESSHPVPGFVAGFGSGENLSDIALQATLECLRTAIAVFVEGERSEVALDSLKNKKSPWWHIWMLQTIESENYVREYLLPKTEAQENVLPEDLSGSDIEFHAINTLKNMFSDIPVVFVQARSNKLLSPQFGDFVADCKTIKRLENFSKKEFVLDVPVPHFYG